MIGVSQSDDPSPGPLDLLGVLMVLILMLRPVGFSGDPGVGWHIASGSWMLEHHAVLSNDPFLFSSSLQGWINNQWLSDIILALIWKAGSWPLLDIFVTMVALAVPFFVLRPLMKEFALNEVAILAALSIVSFEMAIQWFLRPVILSFLIFSVVLVKIYRWQRNDEANLWRVPLLFLLWANLHSGVVLGFVLFALAILAELSKRRPDRVKMKHLAQVGALSLLAIFINPFGYKLFLNAASLADSKYFMNLNQEWLSPSISDLLFAPFYLTIPLFLTAGLLRRQERSSSIRITSFDVIAVAVFLFFALFSRRMIPFYAIVSAFPLAKLFHLWIRQLPMTSDIRRSFERISLKLRNRTQVRYTFGALLAFAIAGFLGFTIRDSSPDGFYSRKIVETIRTSAIGGGKRVFASPNWGGYLTLMTSPNAQPFIDDRNELNGAARYEEFRTVSLGLPGWDDVIRKYNFDFLILNKRDPLLNLLGAAWQSVAEDDEYLLLKRNS